MISLLIVMIQSIGQLTTIFFVRHEFVRLLYFFLKIPLPLFVFPHDFCRPQYCGRSYTINRTNVQNIPDDRPQYCGRQLKFRDLQTQKAKMKPESTITEFYLISQNIFYGLLS